MSHFDNVNSIATNKQGEFKPGVQPSAAPQEHGGVCAPYILIFCTSRIILTL